MSDDPLLIQLMERAEDFVRSLYPAATRAGKLLECGGGLSVDVAGIWRGRVKASGADFTLLDLAILARDLQPEEARAWCWNWLEDVDANAAARLHISNPEPEPTPKPSRIFDPTEGLPASTPEPEELHQLTIYKPGEHGADLHQRVSHLPDIHRLLPQAPDAERGVLCSFLLAPVEIGNLCVDKGITPAHFHLPAHAIIFNRLQLLHAARKSIDFITLTQLLRDESKLDEVGGAAFITELFTFLPTAANVGYYLEILIEKWALRENIMACTEGAARSYDEQDEPWRLIEETQGKMVRITELAQGKRSRLPGLCDISMQMGENLPPPPPELITGLLHQGSKAIIGGTSKGRKTFSLLDMAISVATGAPWWGMPTTKGRVCYINFEIQHPFFCKRAQDICQAKGVTLEKGQLMAWTLRGHTEGIEKMMGELMLVLMRENFVLIIFDPIYKALGDRDENKAGDVASLCNELERVAVKTGAAIAFGAHYSKGNQAAKEAIDRIGGSGVFARDPDSILTMTPHETEECFTVDVTLRNMKPLPPFVVKWDWPMFAPLEFADPLALKQAPKGGTFKATYSEKDILEEMSVIDGLTVGELERRLKEERSMSRATFNRYFGPLQLENKKDSSKGRIMCKEIGGKRLWFLRGSAK